MIPGHKGVCLPDRRFSNPFSAGGVGLLEETVRLEGAINLQKQHQGDGSLITV